MYVLEQKSLFRIDWRFGTRWDTSFLLQCLAAFVKTPLVAVVVDVDVKPGMTSAFIDEAEVRYRRLTFCPRPIARRDQDAAVMGGPSSVRHSRMPVHLKTSRVDVPGVSLAKCMSQEVVKAN